MWILFCFRIYDGRFDAADGDGFGLPTRDGDFKVMGVARDDAIRSQVRRC